MQRKAEGIEKPWLWNIAAVVSLTALNLAICWRLFKAEFTTNFSSVEGFFIGIARYISRHWGDFSWWPMWHCGMPYQDTYVPLLHFTAALTATLGHISAARAYHGVVGVTYALGGVTVYLMAVRLGAKRGAAFSAALLYSLISPSALLMPEIARDIGGFWFPRRLQVLTVYGEGPHVSAMTFLPLVILALESTLSNRTTRAFAGAAVAIAIVFLTNVPGTMALGLTVFCWICAQPRDRFRTAWVVAGAASVMAYGIACFGIPPSSLLTVGSNVGGMHHGFSNSLKYGPLPLLAVLGAVAGAGYLLARTSLTLITRFSLLFFALIAPLAVTARVETYELLPQVGRLHLEMEMGACLLLGIAAYAIYSWIPGWIRPVVLVCCLALVVLQLGHYRERARSDIKYAELPQRSEYTSARWLDANAGRGRVYATGSTGFWLNAFTDTPQLLGCCEQGLAMPVLHEVASRVNAGINPGETEIAITWLRALGVQALVVNGAESNDEYKDFQKPERFAGKLPVLHEEKGDTIYAVSPPGTSLARVLHLGEAVPVRPAHAVNYPDLVKYVEAIGDSARPAALLEWTDGSHARIRANLRRNDLLSVQLAWYPGWKASSGGERREIAADGLGFVLIRPECEGACEVQLAWTGPGDWWLAAAVSLLFLALLGVLLVRQQMLGFR